MWESEQINYFCPLIGMMYMPAMLRRSLDENTELLAKVLAVIVVFINK